MHHEPWRGMFATFDVSAEHLATEAVVAYADGELSLSAHQRAAAHLSVCAECAAEVDVQQRARWAVRAAAPLTVPAGLRGMLCRIPDVPAPDVAVPAVAVKPIAGRRFSADEPMAATVPAAALAEPARRGRRSLPLGVLAVSALAVGVLAATAAAPGAADPPNDPPVRAAAVPRGAEVAAPSSAPHAQLVSFGVMFAGSTQNQAAQNQAARDQGVPAAQTRTSP